VFGFPFWVKNGRMDSARFPLRGVSENKVPNLNAAAVWKLQLRCMVGKFKCSCILIKNQLNHYEILKKFAD
jgi:hypothetical protein